MLPDRLLKLGFDRQPSKHTGQKTTKQRGARLSVEHAHVALDIAPPGQPVVRQFNQPAACRIGQPTVFRS